MRRTIRILAVICSAPLLSASPAENAARPAKNVILMIADGAGPMTWVAANQWQFGENADSGPDHRQVYEQEDFRKFWMATYSGFNQPLPPGQTDVRLGFPAGALPPLLPTLWNELPVFKIGSYDPIKANNMMIGDVRVWANRTGSLLGDRGPLFTLTPVATNPPLVQSLATQLAAAGQVRPHLDQGPVAYDYLIWDSITDSAAAGTAMASGVRTYNSAINHNMDVEPVPFITQHFKNLGMKTGVVTTKVFTDGTPAAFGTQDDFRDDEEEISHAMIHNGLLDVIISPGHPEFGSGGVPRTPSYGTISEQNLGLLRDGSIGWQLVDDPAVLVGMGQGAHALPERLFGLLPVSNQWNSRDTTGRTNAFDPRIHDPENPPAGVVPFVMPDLSLLTKTALDVLGQHENGFFVMIEGASVDSAAHANDLPWLMEETLAFNRAVDAVVQWVENHSSWDETLLIITTDHGNGLLLGPDSATVPFQPTTATAPGQMPLGIFWTTNHTNELVPLWARGPGSEFFTKHFEGVDPVRGDYVHISHVHDVMLEAVPAYTLQLLHLADAEAGLLASQTAPNLAALVDAFDDTYPNTLILSGGDNFIPGPFMSAGTDSTMTEVLRDALDNPTVSTAFGRPDIAIHNILGVEASAIGNHEFDLGSNVLSDAMAIASFPHISLNLDLSADPLNSRFNDVTLDGTGANVPHAATLAGRIVPTATIEKGGEKIGLVGVTTQVLESISSPSGARVKGFVEPRSGVDDMDLLASQVQPYIDELIAGGVDKIILLSHLQQLTNEQLLATKISGVDIILAAGSNTRLGDADDIPVEFPGHAADFAGPYPIVTAGLDGAPTLIVNTDNEFTYLGRLVVDFDADGEIIVPNLATRSIENGAFASTAANVAAAWGVDEADLDTTAFAAGTKGARVKMITDAIQGIIIDKDGQFFGFTSVYLEGERAFVRREETNLGNITADANAIALRSIIGGYTPIVSLKNGGGIRAQIGSIAVGGGEKLPPAANPEAGKPDGAVSKLDIENALRFNNRLMAFETTPQGLKAILEHGIATWPNSGRFPQIGSVAFSWDIGQPAGSRIRNIALIDEDALQTAAIYQNGAFLPNAPASILMVTLNFLANGGDAYPMKANGDNFRFLLEDGTLSDVVDESLNFNVAPANAMGEQKALEDYLAARHATLDTAYATADTPIDEDLRIQKLDVRSDEVLPFAYEELLRLNTFSAAFQEQDVHPLVAILSSSMADAISDTKDRGVDTVLAAPRLFGLFTAPGIRLDEAFLEFTAEATTTMKLQSSGDLENWVDEAVVDNVEIDLSGGRRFFRFQAQETP